MSKQNTNREPFAVAELFFVNVATAFHIGINCTWVCVGGSCMYTVHVCRINIFRSPLIALEKWSLSEHRNCTNGRKAN